MFCVFDIRRQRLNQRKQIFKRYTGPIPDFFGRYIDDCLGTASCTRVDLERFINYINGFHHALKFTWEISETCVSFLDISVSINGDALATSVSYKPTDSHSYLLFSSSHPNHTKQSIPYSHLRLRRLCSDDKDFETKSLEMRTFFQKAFNNSRRDTLKPPLARNEGVQQICQIDVGPFHRCKVSTFIARNVVNDVGGGICKIVPNNEIGFRSGNRCGRVEERTRVTTSTRAK